MRGLLLAGPHCAELAFGAVWMACIECLRCLDGKTITHAELA